MPTDPARVQAVFVAAADLADPAERAAYLDRECAGDPAVRSRVEALLRAVDQPDSLLDAPIVPAAGGETQTLPSDPAATQTHGDDTPDDVADALAFLAPPGRPDSLGRLAHYEVLEVLGRGGFGIVYRAFDDVLQRVVAVKVLAPSMAVTSPARKRFLREAQSGAKIQHENVVRIIEIGEQPLPYLVMEFIAGETLQQRLDRTGPLDVTEVLRIGRQIAAGLAAAQATGLVHRDIKPSNILIGGADGQVKITDFGLARAADDASLTRSGTVAGTPMYMAPEQAKGETLDHRADLFSLGSVLYTMLTGRPPFRASGTLAVLKRVAEDDPRPIRELIPEVPNWLCRIVEKLHAKDPGDRYQSAREVADVLADCEHQLAAHRELKDFARIPAGAARPVSRRRQSPVFIVVLVLAGLMGLAMLAGAAAIAVYWLMPMGGSGAPVPGPALQADSPGAAAGPVQPDEGGWVQLFNGKDLTGWKTHPKQPGDWKVENGVLVGRGPNASHLFSEHGDFRDFHLRLETRLSAGGTSSVFVRCPFDLPYTFGGKALPGGYNCNFEWDGTAVLAGRLFMLGSRPVLARVTVPADTWFTFEVIAQGGRIVVKANGQTTADYTDPERTRVAGHLALAVFSPNTVVQFRKIEIKELPPSSPAVPKTAADVLPYLAGNWKVEQEDLNPDLPRDKAVFIGHLTYDYVAGGKVLRARGNASGDQSVLLHAYDPGQDRLQLWQAYSNGFCGGPTTGAFNPTSRTLTWAVLSGTGTPQNHEFTFTDPDKFTTHLYRLDEKNNIIRLKNMTFTRVKERVAIPNLPADPNRPPEMKVLDRLVGEWHNEVTVTDAATPGKPKRETFRVTAESVLGGRFVEEVVTRDTTSSSDYSLVWFDPEKKRYSRWFFSGSGSVTAYTGTWDEAAKAMTLKSADNAEVMSEVYTNSDRSEFQLTSKDRSGKTVTEITGTARRVAPSDAKRAPAVPKTAAEVLPFLAGSWKLEVQDPDPKVNSEKGVSVQYLTFDSVAGGKIQRVRGTPGIGGGQNLYLNAYNPAQDTLRTWSADSNGHAEGPTIGTFNSDSHSLTWTKVGGGAENHQFTFIDPNTVVTHRYRLDEKNNIVHLAKMKLTRTKEPVAIPNLSTDPNLTAELKVLDRYVGEWRNEVAITSADAPEKPKAEVRRMKAESILGGHFVEIAEANESTGASDYSLAWFDADKKQYRRWFFNSEGRIHDFTGAWDQASQTLTWTTPDGQTERRVVFQSADRRELRRFVKARDGWPAYQLTGVSTRVRVETTRAVPTTAAEVLPFMAGAWKIKKVDVDPMAPKDQATSTGDWVYDFVAGGKVLRGRGWLDGQSVPLVLFDVDPANNTVRQWQAWPDGTTAGPVSGQFVADTRTLMLHHRIGTIDSVHEFVFVDANTFTHSYFHKDAGGKKLRQSLISFTRAPGPVALRALPVDPKRPAQMKNLDRLLGDWQGEMTLKTSSTPDKTEVRSVGFKAESVLAGRFVENASDEEGGGSHYWLVWFNDAANHYRQWHFNSRGQTFDYTGAWDEAGKTMTWTSQDGAMSGRWVFKSEDLREYRMVARGLDGSSMIELNGVVRRTAQPRGVPKTAADVLPYLAGNWKLEKLNSDPKSPPDKDPLVGTWAYGFVADGKFLRGRSSSTPLSPDARTGGLLDLWSIEPGRNMLRRWVARSDGWASDSVSGLFNAASRTLTMSVQIGNIISVHQYEFLDSNTFNHHFSRREAGGAITSEVHHQLTRVGGPVVFPNLPLDPDRPAEMKILDSLVGEWRNELTVTDTATPDKPKAEQAREKVESVLGGRFVEAIETNETNHFDDYWLAWFDADAKKYRSWAFSHAGDVTEFTGTWDDAAKTLTWTGPGGKEGRWIFKSDVLRQFRHVTKAADGKILNEAVGTSLRQVREVPRRAADMLPFMAGNWKVDMQIVEPKLAPDKAKATGYQVNDYVAGGRFLRTRAATEDGSSAGFVLYSYDAGKDVLTFRGVWSNGTADDNVLGRFDPADHSVLWLKRNSNGDQFVHQLKVVDTNTITSRSYTQDESGKVISDLRLTFTRMSKPVTLPDRPTDPKRPAEMKVLDQVVGEWRNERTVSVAGPDTKVETLHVKAEPILGGRFLEKFETNETNGASDYTLNWFDAGSKKYRLWFFNHTGSVTEFTGAWDQATKTLTWNSVDGRLEGRLTFKSNDLYDFRRIVKDKDGKVLSETASVSRRVAGGSVPGK